MIFWIITGIIFILLIFIVQLQIRNILYIQKKKKLGGKYEKDNHSN